MFIYSEMLQQMDYDNIIKQINNDNSNHFGDKVNALILTDRLTGCAEGLKQYLECYPEITVNLIHNETEFHNISVKFDVIIIVGYLAKSNSYNIIEKEKQINDTVISIFYARIDDCILSKKYRYHIDDCFDRDLPVKDFIYFLRNRYEIAKVAGAAKEENAIKPQEVIEKRRGTMFKIFKKIGLKAIVLLAK